MSARTKIQFYQLLVLLGAWMAFAIVMTLYDHLIINSMNSNGASSFYSFQYALVSNCISAMIGGLTGGSFLIFVINTRYDTKPIISTVLVATVVYLGVIAIIVVVITCIAYLHALTNSIEVSNTWNVIKRFLSDDTRIKNIFTWYCVVAITQVILQINKRFGEGNLLRILKGQYNVAHQERKIFMFLDLNDSTRLAESLGDEQYHGLLRDFFADISDEIVNNGGRIYQYVGDEVVVQWDYQEDGPNDRCVKTFFDIKAKMSREGVKYVNRYGVVPSFKAGLHYGRVIAGEVGTVKREITYSGDVLNTAARIMSMCTRLNTDLLLSSELASILGGRYEFHTHGAFALKGKEREVTLQSYMPLNSALGVIA
ncbi:adenylate/guanylate cyclase domain-containing protein [Chryseolinea sp. T2]|uniref:adenylate/guanylate cyclase domain-containing protein n=1 Tax=Chryseolinea sp. T2 TaxID=3129255 RepID=UPI0030779AEF